MTIFELHQHLEETVTELNHNMLSPAVFKNADGVELDQLKWEVTISRFGFRSGKVESYYSIPVRKKSGIKIQQLPDPNLLGDNALVYLKSRSESAKNPFLVIRYNQVLFRSGQRRNQQGERVIDASFDLFARIDRNDDDGRFAYWGILLNAFFLSLDCEKYRFSELTELTFQLIDESAGHYLNMNRLIDGVNINRKRMAKSLLRRIHDRVLPLTNAPVANGDAMFTEHLLMSLSKLGSSLGEDSRVYHLACGEAYENRADLQISEPNNMSATISLVCAMTYYQRAGNQERLDTAGLKYASIKHDVGLTKITLGGKGQVSEEAEALHKKIIEHTGNLSGEDIYHFLSKSKWILPNTGSSDDEDEPTALTILDAFTNARYDVNANARVIKGDGRKNRLFENYSMEFKAFHSHVLYSIFMHGISSGSINLNSLLNYLITHSWLGQVLEERNVEGDAHPYSWFFELSHYLLQFFLQMDGMLLQPGIPTSFQTSIEGLSLKMEPILRDLLQRLNVNTLKIPKENVIREMHLEELIQRLNKFDVVDQQNIMYLRYLYTSEGRNVRNNVAHGFLRMFQFSHFEGFLLILSNLRISAFRLVKEEE
jgi:hypothetical protein